MGMTVTGISTTLVGLRRTEERTNKRLLRLLRRSAVSIRDLAREYAPVDEGNLEEAIVVAEATDGLFRRRQMELIGVDPDLLGEGYTRYGFRYDIRMHEGRYNLGERSQAKAAASGRQVGPKYLSRAFQDLEDGIKAEAEKIARESTER